MATTPRKARHARHSSSLFPPTSDYESDAGALAASAANQEPYAPPPPRTNTELNLSVLRRYIPSVQSLLSIAANAVVYSFDAASETWDKAGIEGTLFVCTQLPDDQAVSGASVFVLNRRGLDNLSVHLAHVSHVEMTDGLVILRIDAHADSPDRVLGIWIHNDKDETRDINGAMIIESWKAVSHASGATEVPGAEAESATTAAGKRPSLAHAYPSQDLASTDT
ncbi:hypothetical protein CDD81_4796 [Ophiocordyceps australis]|uniref:Uncharacterized protein n=1 Tax=Ophiocordyceps australis TaxID=1399860 RepID=A0A2C5YAM2_9HYPO|nr:hypothetical protein CDD81_4796 [Ophiocordyceps australis]